MPCRLGRLECLPLIGRHGRLLRLIIIQRVEILCDRVRGTIFLILDALVLILVEVVVNGRMSSWHKLGSEVAGDSELLLSSEWAFEAALHDLCACCSALVAGVEPVIDRLVLVHAD